jgi:hypothetical protein
MADIPGIDEPLDHVLAQTHSKPHWSPGRVRRATAATRIHPQQHQTLHPNPHRQRLHQLVGLEANPGYNLAMLRELMIGSGSVAMSCRYRRGPA